MARSGIFAMASAIGPIVAAFTAAPVVAGSASATVTVSATVEESCRIDARPLGFGTMLNDRTVVDAQSSVSLACTPAAPYVVAMDDGRHGSDGTRHMADASGAHLLAYELYSDPARTRRWGATPLTSVGAIAPANGEVNLTVYGRLSADRAVAASYADVVTITVNF